MEVAMAALKLLLKLPFKRAQFEEASLTSVVKALRRKNSSTQDLIRQLCLRFTAKRETKAPPAAPAPCPDPSSDVDAEVPYIRFCAGQETSANMDEGAEGTKALEEADPMSMSEAKLSSNLRSFSSAADGDGDHWQLTGSDGNLKGVPDGTHHVADPKRQSNEVKNATVRSFGLASGSEGPRKPPPDASANPHRASRSHKDGTAESAFASEGPESFLAHGPQAPADSPEVVEVVEDLLDYASKPDVPQQVPTSLSGSRWVDPVDARMEAIIYQLHQLGDLAEQLGIGTQKRAERLGIATSCDIARI
ncbi:unnamed protein product [Durusdinium trenchii]|uniref:Uncharacterized protein n=1 Tax=Durusdinium trenchii TaxID=1381693 RepID=A0ABP0NAK4_9DINO